MILETDLKWKQL